MGLLRRLLPPTVDEHDPAFDVFDRGCWELVSREGQPAGHVASVLWRFRTPFRPLLKQDWIWLLVIWPDGSREMPLEEYPPWRYVADLLGGEFEWAGTTYEARRLADGERERAWIALGITEEDFSGNARRSWQRLAYDSPR